MRIRAQECNDGAILDHPRLLEYLEAAFIEAWRAHAGPLTESLGGERRPVTYVCLDAATGRPCELP